MVGGWEVAIGTAGSAHRPPASAAVRVPPGLGYSALHHQMQFQELVVKYVTDGITALSNGLHVPGHRLFGGSDK